MKSSQGDFLLSFIGLSLATPPFIMSILFLYFLGEFLNSLGKVSEEVFRAERLPLLNLKDLENMLK